MLFNPATNFRALAVSLGPKVVAVARLSAESTAPDEDRLRRVIVNPGVLNDMLHKATPYMDRLWNEDRCKGVRLAVGSWLPSATDLLYRRFLPDLPDKVCIENGLWDIFDHDVDALESYCMLSLSNPFNLDRETLNVVYRMRGRNLDADLVRFEEFERKTGWSLVVDDHQGYLWATA